MHIYKDKKGQEKYIIAGQVFTNMNEVMNYLVDVKQLTPAVLEVYLSKHTNKPSINKKQAIQTIRDITNVSIKKASMMLE